MFAGLGASDLRFLASSLRQGSLGPPYSVLSLQRKGLPESVLRDFENLAGQGFNAQQIAVVAAALAEALVRDERNRQHVDLVATGPDAEAHVRDTAVVVEQLFAEACSRVLVVGFAVYDGDEIFATLGTRMDEIKALDVTCCFDIAPPRSHNLGAERVVDDFAFRFSKWWPGNRRPAVYYDPRSLSADPTKRAVLHAKAVVVDGLKALITSANPTPAAYRRNIELGVVFTGGVIPMEIEAHFRELIRRETLRLMPKDTLK